MTRLRARLARAGLGVRCKSAARARRSAARTLAGIAACMALGLAAGCGPAAEPAGGATASEGLVFSRPTDRHYDLVQARLSDGAERVLRETPERVERWPYWSEAAGLLVFQSGPERRSERLELYDPRTGSFRRLLAEDARFENWPAWSPDGEYIAYAFGGAPSKPRAGLAVVHVASRERRLLILNIMSRGRFFRAEWAPDSRTLVAQRRHEQESDLWIFAREGGEPRRLTANPGGRDSKARFTRDGRWIVFERANPSTAPPDLYLIRPDGSGLRHLAGDAGAADHSAWPSPSRDEVVFVSDRHGQDDLFLATLPEGRVRALVETPDIAEYTPRWSPDGERVAFLRAPPGEPAAEEARVVATDRAGRTLFEARGQMVNWMPPWRAAR